MISPANFSPCHGIFCCFLFPNPDTQPWAFCQDGGETPPHPARGRRGGGNGFGLCYREEFRGWLAGGKGKGKGRRGRGGGEGVVGKELYLRLAWRELASGFLGKNKNLLVCGSRLESGEGGGEGKMGEKGSGWEIKTGLRARSSMDGITGV